MHATLILETPSAAESLAHDGSYLTDLSWESKAAGNKQEQKRTEKEKKYSLPSTCELQFKLRS